MAEMGCSVSSDGLDALNFLQKLMCRSNASLVEISVSDLRASSLTASMQRPQIQRPCGSFCFSSPNQLQRVTKLGEGLLEDPENVAVDENGTFCIATKDGWIRRLHRNGSWENWKKLHSRTLLGITTAKRGGLFVCDCEKVKESALVPLKAKAFETMQQISHA
ncbi:hypothetical protein REPUB_Repub03eG0057000 [Reevesia pubescens]